MENHPHGRFPFSTVEDTLLCHTWCVACQSDMLLQSMCLGYWRLSADFKGSDVRSLRTLSVGG